jgi:predicted TPR repeat methyltransferase
MSDQNPISNKRPSVKNMPSFKEVSGGMTRLLDEWSDWVADKYSAFTGNMEKMRDIAKNNYELGTMHLERGNVTDAIFRFKLVTMLEPKNVDAWFFLGTSYMADSKMALAEKALEKAVNLRNDFEEARYMLAVAKGKNAKASDLPSRMPVTLARSHFDSVALNYNNEQLSELGYEGHAILCKMLRSHLREDRVDYEIIELGVGTGLCGPEIRNVASRIVGIDMSEHMLTEARRLLDTNGQKIYDVLLHKEMHEFLSEAPAQSADIILSAGAFSFVGDLSEVYAHTARILRPGGLFAFTADPMLGEGFSFDSTAGRFCFSEQYLKAQAEANGLTLVQMEEAPAYPAYPVWFCVFTK